MRNTPIALAAAALGGGLAIGGSVFAAPKPATIPLKSTIQIQGKTVIGSYVMLNTQGGYVVPPAGWTSGTLKFVDLTKPKLDSTAPGIILDIGISGAPQDGGNFTYTVHGLSFQFTPNMAKTQGRFEFIWKTSGHQVVTQDSRVFTVGWTHIAHTKPPYPGKTLTDLAVRGALVAGRSVTIQEKNPLYAMLSGPSENALVGRIWFIDRTKPKLDTSMATDAQSGGGFTSQFTKAGFHLPSAAAHTQGQFEVVWPLYGGGFLIEQTAPFAIQ